MIVDTSALMAILRLEPEAGRLLEAIRKFGTRLMSAATLVEATVVAGGCDGDEGVRELDAALARLRIQVAPSPPTMQCMHAELTELSGRGSIRPA